MLLAQSVFPCTAVGQKDCAPTAFRYRFAAAAPCHGSGLCFYRRGGELPVIANRPALFLSLRTSPQAGVGIRLPVPRAAGADTLSLRANPRCCCHSEPVLTLAWESVPPILLRRAAPHLPQPPLLRRLGRDLIIAHPTGREFPKGEGAHALSLWTLQGDRIFKGRGKFGIPLPLNGVFGYFCRC